MGEIRRNYGRYELVFMCCALALAAFLFGGLQFNAEVRLTCRKLTCTLTVSDASGDQTMGPLLVSPDRQRSFVALVGEKVRRLDGSAPFLAALDGYFREPAGLELDIRCGHNDVTLRSPWLLALWALPLVLVALFWYRVTVTVDRDQVMVRQQTLFGGRHFFVRNQDIKAVRTIARSTGPRSPGTAEIVFVLDDGGTVSITGHRRNYNTQAIFAAAIQGALQRATGQDIGLEN